MTLSEFTLAERGFSDLNILIREYWQKITPTSPETWAEITNVLQDEKATTFTASDAATSLSETALSQSALSDLGLLVTREAWRDILGTTTVESWSGVSPSGSESWSNITPSGSESWTDIKTVIN